MTKRDEMVKVRKLQSECPKLNLTDIEVEYLLDRAIQMSKISNELDQLGVERWSPPIIFRVSEERRT